MLDDLRGAFAFLTILPVGQVAGQPGRTFAYYPLVGLVIGGLLALPGALPPPADLRAFLLLAAWVGVTGGLHLDGFGDSCDGLLATATPERRLDIMKDPRAGTWAVVGLALLLLGKWIALRGVAGTLLILPPVLGRWVMVVAALGFPYARQQGVGGYFREGLGQRQAAIATVFMVVVVTTLALSSGGRVLIAAALAIVVALLAARWAAGRLGGGLTGDVYGALCELAELVCLLALVG